MMKKNKISADCSIWRLARFASLLLVLGFFGLVLPGLGTTRVIGKIERVTAPSQQSDHGVSLWQDVDEKSIPNPGDRPLIPRKYRTLHLNRSGLKQLLNGVPLEQHGAPRGTGVEIALPMPEGDFVNFLV